MDVTLPPFFSMYNICPGKTTFCNDHVKMWTFLKQNLTPALFQDTAIAAYP